VRTPRLSAEFAIGPALGQYRTAPPGGGPAALAPMTTGQLRRQADTDARTIEYLTSYRDNGASPCPGDQHVCWSSSTDPNHYVDYMCCDMDQACDHQADGTPFCREGQAQSATPVLANGHVRHLPDFTVDVV
jgi:hypothetical protein